MKETQRGWGGAERQGDKNPKPAPNSELSARSRCRAWTHEPLRSWHNLSHLIDWATAGRHLHKLFVTGLDPVGLHSLHGGFAVSVACLLSIFSQCNVAIFSCQLWLWGLHVNQAWFSPASSPHTVLPSREKTRLLKFSVNSAERCSRGLSQQPWVVHRSGPWRAPERSVLSPWTIYSFQQEKTLYCFHV